ncbi:MAG: DUF882 domain-containing protein [Hyphomicrobiales bacterium]
MADLPHWASHATANGDVRTISFYNVHNKETLKVTYKKDGRYIPSAMKQINHIMRDWRQNAPTRMDPKLVDLIWELRQELGAKAPTHLISGYRSPKTNKMLRRIGRKVARRSMHIKGQAADLYFPDVPLVRLRNSALVREVGGVGYYPRSGKHGFVHVDTGRVRHWPRLSKTKLASIFRNHKTKHNARDTKGPIYLTQRNRAGTNSAGARQDATQRLAKAVPLPRPKPSIIAGTPQPAEKPPATAPADTQTVVAQAKPAAPNATPQTVTFAALSPAPSAAPAPAPAPARQEQPATRPRLVFFPLAILKRDRAQVQTATAEEQPVPVQKAVAFRGSMTDITTAALAPQLAPSASRSATRQFSASELARVARQVVNRPVKGNLLMSLHARPVPNSSDKSAPLNMAQVKIDLRGPSFTTAVEDVEDAAANEPVDPAGEQPVAIPNGLGLR